MAITDIRRLVYGLRPPALDDLGLVGALEQAAALHNSAGGPAIQVKATGLPTLPAAVEVAAFRIAEEAMANAIKHSGAGTCDVSLKVEGGNLVVTSIDDGVGLPGVVQAGVGLRSMRERAEELGGQFDIGGAGRGTVVCAAIPISRLPEQVTA